MWNKSENNDNFCSKELSVAPFLKVNFPEKVLKRLFFDFQNTTSNNSNQAENEDFMI